MHQATKNVLKKMTFKSLNLDAAIIDLDGTMVDTMGDFVEAINLMLRDLGLSPVGETVVALRVGKGSENLVNSVITHALNQSKKARAAPKNIVDAKKALALFQQHYGAVIGRHAHVYPGVVDGLLALQRSRLKLACLTNKPVGFARELLRLKGLDGFFNHVFGGDSFEAKKPHPMPVLMTCEALGTRPTRTLVVGDSSNDAQAAHSAGCPVVLVTYGYNHGQPVASAGADATISSLMQLSPLLGLKG